MAGAAVASIRCAAQDDVDREEERGEDFEEIFHRYIPKAQAQALLDELKVTIQPPKAEEGSMSCPGSNGVAGKQEAEAGKDCGSKVERG